MTDGRACSSLVTAHLPCPQIELPERNTPWVIARAQRRDACSARGPPCTPNRKTEVNWTLENLASGRSLAPTAQRGASPVSRPG